MLHKSNDALSAFRITDSNYFPLLISINTAEAQPDKEAEHIDHWPLMFHCHP